MSELTTTEDGKFNLGDLQSQLQFADNLLKQKVISETFKTPQQVVIAIQFCKELNIPPMTGLKNMYVVHGKPSLYGDGPLSIIQSSGLVDFIDEFWVDSSGEKICVANKNLSEEPYAAVCRIKRKDDEHVQEDYFSVKDMTLAQMKSNVWTKYQRTMMRYRARTQAIKSKFADVLSGIGIVEYDTPNMPKEGVITELEVSPISDDSIIEIQELCQALGRDMKQLLNYASKLINHEINSITELNQKDADIIITSLKEMVKKLNKTEVVNEN